MVAVIKTASSISRALNYNENKVKEGKAECISAGNYPIDPGKLSFNQKLNRLLKQAALNENVTCNSVHISLNFDPSEKISKELLKEISETYLEKIGFANQPYLLYEHRDAGHPHVHIVTTNIKADGKRIELHNLGRNESEKARKEIEQLYNLVKAEESKQKQASGLKPVNIQKVQYGRTETKRAIANVLDAVLNNYRFASLPELNAVLKQFNVLADRGSENSRIYQHKGLVYRVVDEQGNKVGVPVKASDFYNKPTLVFLEKKFEQNEALKLPHRSRVKNTIDLALIRQKDLTVEGLMKALEKEGIRTVLRQNAAGILYGITYVDFTTKCVFNGSDLGKQYSAKGVQERCAKGAVENKETAQEGVSTTAFEKQFTGAESTTEKSGSLAAELVENLLKTEYTSGFIPHQLKGKKKKKKRGHSL